MEITDDADDLLPIMDGWLQFTGVVVEHLVFDAKNAARGLRLLITPSGELDAADLVMARCAVGVGDEFHAMSEGGVERRNSAGLDVAVVGVSAENEDVEFVVRHVGSPW